MGLALAVACASGAVCAERGDAGASSQYDAMIARHAQANGVPETLVRRIIVRESKYNPKARNGPYWGMMQMSVATARGAGFRGQPSELLDAETNLRYGVRYLAGAYKTARGNHDRAVGFYARGYYYAAKRQGMLASIGMGRDGKLSAPAETPAAATVQTAAIQTPAQPTLASLPATAAAPVVQTASAVPLPPIRPAAPTPAVGPTLAAAATIPMPPVRGPATGPALAQAAKPNGPRTIDVAAAAAPQMASIIPLPTPRPRDEPVSTGSITPRAAAPRSGATAAQPAAPAPVVATGPAIPLPTPRDAAAPAAKSAPVQPALAFAEPARTAAGAPIPALRGSAPMPPRR